MQLWDVRRKGCIFTYKGHSEVINSIQFSPDGKWVVSASSDSTTKVQVGLLVVSGPRGGGRGGNGHFCDSTIAGML